MHGRSELVRRQGISRRQGIPTKYLDQILGQLRRGGLIDSVRGRDGGYTLATDPCHISVWQIFHTVEGNGIFPVACVSDHHGCGFEDGCVTADPWKMIFDSMKAQLVGLTLEELYQRFSNEKKMCPVAGVRECIQIKSSGGVVC